MIVLLKTSTTFAATPAIIPLEKKSPLQQNQNTTIFWICFLFTTSARYDELFA